MRFYVLYYFVGTHDFQNRASAVAGIGAPSVPSRRTRLSPISMPVPFGYMFYDNAEIDSESSEVTVSILQWGAENVDNILWIAAKGYLGVLAKRGILSRDRFCCVDCRKWHH